MKVTDYIAQFLSAHGIKVVFGLTGGAAVHFFDSLDKAKGMKTVFCHHEQAAALAAVAYARVTNNLGAAIFTTGPGGTNAVTGVAAAWQDSIPCVFISGQARKDHTTNGKPLRQVGIQELDIVSVVKPITKYAVMVESLDEIRYHLEKALFIARSGRPGPVWIDIPLDFQWAEVDIRALKGFKAPHKQEKKASADLGIAAKKTWELLSKAQRPLVLVGYGVRLARAEKEFAAFIEKYKIPFVSSWTAGDILPTAHPLFAGRVGVFGQRGANLAVQNCDLLIALGSHLSIPITGTVFKAFARNAKVVMVDIDPQEFRHQRVHVDLTVCNDAKVFLQKVSVSGPCAVFGVTPQWAKALSSYRRYNQVPAQWFKQKKRVNSYVFIDQLSDCLSGKEAIVVDGGGTNLFVSFQAFKVKGSQRLTTSSGISAMGTGLPESVGACFARRKQRTICLSGDGSMQLNIQELQTIAHHWLPIKIFVMNNRGYLAIRHTQGEFLNSRFIGSGPEGGVSLPSFVKVAKAYGIPATEVRHHRELKQKIQKVLSTPGPFLCEIMIAPDQVVHPRVGFTRNPNGTFSPLPLEDMFPFIPRDEFKKNMLCAR